jgi:PAS domain S-box-containing protein
MAGRSAATVRELRGSRARAAASSTRDELFARLAAIVESSDDAIISKDLNGIITSWNPAAERMFGYTAAEIVGKSIRTIVPDDRESEEDDVLRRIVAGEAVAHFETVRRRKDGSEVIVSLTVSPIRNRRGTIIGASETARDITERKRESQRAMFLADLGPLLAASLDHEAMLADVARLTTMSFAGTQIALADYCVIDILEQDGTLRRVATAHYDPDRAPLLEQLHRYSPDRERSIVTRPLRTGQPLLLPRIGDLEIDQIVSDAEHRHITLELGPKSIITVPLTARGTTFGLLTLVRSDRTAPFDSSDLAFASEIAQRAAVAVDNARLYTESQKAVREREHVLAIVSHDLRNSLGTIATSARLLLVSPADEQQRTRRLETITRICQQMTHLMQDLLDVSRLDEGHRLRIEPAALEVRALIRDACDSFRAKSEDKLIALQCDVADPLLKISADRDRVQQVLSNLIGNAFKFTPEGGTITVRAQAVDGFVQFSVGDTGPGIRAEDLPHIFERYWQAKRTAHLGTGLGLPIAKGIVEAHGGRIWVESTAGVGAAFYFTIPLAPTGPETNGRSR